MTLKMSSSHVLHILVIQTAFIGDAILATSFLKEVKRIFPTAKIHFLVRSDVKSLFSPGLLIDYLWIWEKKKSFQKYKNLFLLYQKMSSFSFDKIFNLQRFFTMNIFSSLLKANERVGFKNVYTSIFFSKTYVHHLPYEKKMKDNNINLNSLDSFYHEVERNAELLSAYDPTILQKNVKDLRPILYLNNLHILAAPRDQESGLSAKVDQYVVMGPCSAWKTKEWPMENWKKLAASLLIDSFKRGENLQIFFVGSPSEFLQIEKLKNNIQQYLEELHFKELALHLHNKAQELTLLQTATLLKNAKRAYANDSALLHLASAVNTPVTAFFCSTLTSFGFFPLSDDVQISEYNAPLACRPCGIHGKKSCPEHHFKCADHFPMGLRKPL